MRYLSGAVNRTMRDDLANGNIGLLQTPASSYALDGVAVWALDNGAYTGNYPGDAAYMRLLDRLDGHRSRCLFVAAPDVVGDAAATLARFPPIAVQIRAAGWPVALVAQDGMTPDAVPWTDVDWLFIGGSTDWKLSHAVVDLIRAAQTRHVRVHVGRVNSWRRYHRFAGLGCDSADGTFIAFGPDKNIVHVYRWLAAPIQGGLL